MVWPLKSVIGVSFPPERYTSDRSKTGLVPIAVLASLDKPDGSVCFTRKITSPFADRVSSYFSSFVSIPPTITPSMLISRRFTFSRTRVFRVWALMVTLKEFCPSLGVIGITTATPFAVLPFFLASFFTVLMADWTVPLSTATFPSLSGVAGLVWLVVGISGLVSSGRATIVEPPPEEPLSPLEEPPPPDEEPPPLPEPPELF